MKQKEAQYFGNSTNGPSSKLAREHDSQPVLCQHQQQEHRQIWQTQKTKPQQTCCGVFRTSWHCRSTDLHYTHASVEELATLFCTTVAGQLVAGILDRELVVVGELLPTADAPRGKYDDVLLAVHSDDPGVAVGLTGVVDEAGSVAMHRGIYHLIVIDTKHIAADSL